MSAVAASNVGCHRHAVVVPPDPTRRIAVVVTTAASTGLGKEVKSFYEMPRSVSQPYRRAATNFNHPTAARAGSLQSVGIAGG